MTTENQTHIPEGWKESELGAVIVEKAKSTIKVSDAANFGEFPFFTSGDSILLHDRKIIEGENLFLATGGVANIKYFKGEAAYSTDTFAISTNEDTKAQYLYYYLLSKVGYINKNYFEGSGLKHLQKKDFRKHVFVLPSSPTEQRKIASILSKLDEAITQTEQLIGKYKKIKEGLMHDLLTRGIDEQGNIRSEETHKFKDSPLGRIPEEWEVVPFETYYKSPIRDFGSFSSTKLITFLEEGIPFIKSEMIEENNINWESVSFISYDVHKLLTKSYVNKNNILFSKIGSALGKAAIYNGEYLNCNSNAAVAKIDIDNNLALNKYVCAFLNSTFAKNQFSFMIISLLPRINLGDINKLLIFKLPVEEQSRIIHKLNKTQNLIDNTTDLISKLTSLKSGLMHDLLTGKVRIQI